MNPVIERLAADATPINFWLGSECSASMFSWSEAETLKFARIQNPQIGQALSLVETFSAMPPDRREAFRTSFCSRMNWSYRRLPTSRRRVAPEPVHSRSCLPRATLLPVIDIELGTYESDSPTRCGFSNCPCSTSPRDGAKRSPRSQDPG